MKLGLRLGLTKGGGFNPESVSDLLAWWDASDSSTFTFQSGTTIGDATVDEIASKVGSESLQAIANVGGGSNRPAWVYGLNGKPALSNIDDIDSGMFSVTSNLYQAGRTYFSVHRVYENATTTVLTGSNSSAGRIALGSDGGLDYLQNQSSASELLESGIGPSTGIIVQAIVFTSTSSLSHYRGSGTSANTFDPSNTGNNRYYRAFGDYAGGAGTGKQDWHESLVYDRVLTETEVNQVLRYLESKWADSTLKTGVVIAGQSNATGTASLGSASTFDQEISRFQVWNYADNLVNYDPSVAIADNTNTNYSVFNDSGSAGYSMGPAVMNYLSRRIGGKIVIIPASKGGTQLTEDTEWGNRTTDFDTATEFGALNERIKLAKQSGISIRHLIWQQGEADATTAVAATEAEYDAALDTLIDDIRRVNGDMFVSVGVIPDTLPGGSYPNRTDVQAAQLAFSKANVVVNDTSGEAVQGDNVHFSVAGLDAVGALHAADILTNL